MTTSEKNQEILRLLPYAVGYLQAYLATPAGDCFVKAVGGLDDAHAFVRCFLVDFVNSGKPAAYLKQSLKWEFVNELRRARRARRVETVSLESLAVDFAAPEAAATGVRFALFKATTNFSYLTRAAMRDSILNGTKSYAQLGISSSTYASLKKVIFKEIKNILFGRRARTTI